MRRQQGKNGKYACVCCGYATITEVANYDICPICFWEDDGQDSEDADTNYEGANQVSLTQGRRNFLDFGAAESKDKRHVRSLHVNDEQLMIYKIQEGRITDESIF